MALARLEEEYYLGIERRLWQLEAELQQLAEETDRSMTRPSETLAELRASFEERARLLRGKLSEVRDAGESASDELRSGIEAAWTELRTSLARARDVLQAHEPSNIPAA